MDQENCTSTTVMNSCKVAWTSEMDDDLLQAYEIYGEKWNELVDILDVEHLTGRDCEKRFKKLIVSFQKKWTPQQDTLLRSLIIDQNLPIDVVALKLEKSRVDCEVRWKLINRSLPDNPEISMNQTESRTTEKNLKQPLSQPQQQPQLQQQQTLPSDLTAIADLNEQNFNKPATDLVITHKIYSHNDEIQNDSTIHNVSSELPLLNRLNSQGVAYVYNTPHNEIISTNYDASLTMIPISNNMNTQNAQVLSFNCALIPTTSTEVSYTAIPYQHFTATPNSYQHFTTPYKHITVNVNNTTAVNTINANNIAMSSIGNCNPMSALTTQMPNSTTATIGTQQKPTAIPMYWSKDMISRLVTATNTIQGANFWDQVAAYVGHNVTAMHCYTKYKGSFCLYNTSAASWTDAERTVLKLLSTKQIPRIVVGGILRRSVKECKEECLRLYGHSLTHTVPASSATINNDTLQAANATKLFQEAIGKENEVVNEKKKQQQQQMPTKILERSPFVDWTDEMDGHLLDAIDALGTNQWVKVADRVAGRTNVAVSRGKCKSRYYTNIRIDHVWSPEQDEQLRSLVTANQSWESICEVTQRSYVVCRYRWFYLDKWVKAAPLPDTTTSAVSTGAETLSGTTTGYRRRSTSNGDKLDNITKQSDLLSHKRKRSHPSSNGLLEQQTKASKRHSSLVPSHILLTGLFETNKVKGSNEENDSKDSSESKTIIAIDVETVLEPWTTEEDSKLWHLRVHNHAGWQDITRKLGRTVDDCVDRWQIIGDSKKLKSHGATPQTTTVNTAARTTTPKSTHTKEISRSERNQKTLNKENVKKKEKNTLQLAPNWTSEEVQQLVALRTARGGRMAWEDIARKLEKSTISCQKQWQYCKQIRDKSPVVQRQSDKLLEQIDKCNIPTHGTGSNNTHKHHKHIDNIKHNDKHSKHNDGGDVDNMEGADSSSLASNVGSSDSEEEWTVEQLQQYKKRKGALPWHNDTSITTTAPITLVSATAAAIMRTEQQLPTVVQGWTAEEDAKLRYSRKVSKLSWSNVAIRLNKSVSDAQSRWEKIRKYHSDGKATHSTGKEHTANKTITTDRPTHSTIDRRHRRAVGHHNSSAVTVKRESKSEPIKQLKRKRELTEPFNNLWTPDDDVRLTKYKANNTSWHRISKRLNKNMDDCQVRWIVISSKHKETVAKAESKEEVNRHLTENTPENTVEMQTVWTAKEDASLLEHRVFRQRNFDTIGRILDRSEEDCAERFHVLKRLVNEKMTNAHLETQQQQSSDSSVSLVDIPAVSELVNQSMASWTADEDAELFRLRMAVKVGYEFIAKRMKRPVSECRTRWYLLSLLDKKVDISSNNRNNSSKLSSTSDIITSGHLEEFETDEAMLLAHSLCENNAGRNSENATSEHNGIGSDDINSSSDGDSDDDDISTSTIASDSDVDISTSSRSGTIVSDSDSLHDSEVDKDSYQPYSSSGDMSEFESEIESDSQSESSTHSDFNRSDGCSKSNSGGSFRSVSVNNSIGSRSSNYGNNHAALRESSVFDYSDMAELNCDDFNCGTDGIADSELDIASCSSVGSVYGRKSFIGCDEHVGDSLHSNHTRDSAAGSGSDVDSLSIQSQETVEMDIDGKQLHDLDSDIESISDRESITNHITVNGNPAMKTKPVSPVRKAVPKQKH